MSVENSRDLSAREHSISSSFTMSLDNIDDVFESIEREFSTPPPTSRPSSPPPAPQKQPRPPISVAAIPRIGMQVTEIPSYNTLRDHFSLRDVEEIAMTLRDVVVESQQHLMKADRLMHQVARCTERNTLFMCRSWFRENAKHFAHNLIEYGSAPVPTLHTPDHILNDRAMFYVHIISYIAPPKNSEEPESAECVFRIAIVHPDDPTGMTVDPSLIDCLLEAFNPNFENPCAISRIAEVLMSLNPNKVQHVLWASKAPFVAEEDWLTKVKNLCS